MVFGTGLEWRVQVEGLAGDGDEADTPDPVDGIPAAQVTLRQLEQSDKIETMQKTKIMWFIPVLPTRNAYPGSQFFHPGSRVKKEPFPGSWIRIRNNEFK
jgi:hypothetical protein